MAKHRTLLDPDNYNQTKYYCITLPFTAVLQSCICFRMRINLTNVRVFAQPRSPQGVRIFSLTNST
jgi:hypothetical protein